MGPFYADSGVLGSWYDDYAGMVNNNTPWFRRGGDGVADKNNRNGIFTFQNFNGNNTKSFRIVLV